MELAARVLSSPAIDFSVARDAPVVDGNGEPVGRSRRVDRGWAIDDLSGNQVLRVGRGVFRAFHNDRYPVFDGADEQIGWLGCWEGVLLGDERIGRFATRRWFGSDCLIVGNSRRRPRRELGVLQRVARPGRRTAWFSDRWCATFAPDEHGEEIRILVAAAAYVWHDGRGEE